MYRYQGDDVDTIACRFCRFGFVSPDNRWCFCTQEERYTDEGCEFGRRKERSGGWEKGVK